ncbi:MAG: FkbM family methyltransferase, partial [Alteriqipengyuania sp.]
MYMAARGEPLRNLPEASGEIYIQQKVAAALTRKPGAAVLDVGGNLGQWSIQFLKTARSGGVNLDTLAFHTFEPVPATREKLTVNIAAAGFETAVTIHPVALSDTVGETHINILGSETSGRNSIVDDPLQQETPLDRLTIRTTTLRDFCAETGIDHVDFIKIDAEGHDFHVIKGAESLLKDGRVGAIQFEYTKRWIDSRTFLKDVFALVASRRYTVYRAMPNRLERLEAWHPELERFFAANFVLVHDDAQGWFDIHPGRFDR